MTIEDTSPPPVRVLCGLSFVALLVLCIFGKRAMASEIASALDTRFPKHNYEATSNRKW
jgi:hypothetical protein